MKFLAKLWRGEYSLAKTYWLFNVLAGVVVNIPISIFGMLSQRAQSENATLFFAFICLTVSYGLIALVGLWRSSNNYTGNQFWAVISKIVVCIGLLFVGSSIVTTFAVGAGYALFAILSMGLAVAYIEHYSASEKNNPIQPIVGVSQSPSKNIIVDNVNSELVWEDISKEFNSSIRKEGLWTKCFVESNGDENKAKLQYLKIRFDEESKKPIFQEKQESSKGITSTSAPVASSKMALQQDIFTINAQPKVDSVDYNQYAASSLLSKGMFVKKQYKDRTLFYLHNGNVASISGQLVKVFDSDVFLKKAIDKGTIGDRHPSGLLVSFDKDSIK
jgi:hypothetical protein